MTEFVYVVVAGGVAGQRPLSEGWPERMPGTATSYQPLVTMLGGKPGFSEGDS